LSIDAPSAGRRSALDHVAIHRRERPLSAPSLSDVRPRALMTPPRVSAIVVFACGVGLSTASRVDAQQKPIEPAGLNVLNRRVTSLRDGATTGVRLSEATGEGVAYCRGLSLPTARSSWMSEARTFRNRASSALPFTALMARRMTRSISDRSTSGPTTPRDGATPYSTSPIRPTPGRSCAPSSQEVRARRQSRAGSERVVSRTRGGREPAGERVRR